ncbi:MAG: chorismate lyase [Gammaproteobacteria bacterium]
MTPRWYALDDAQHARIPAALQSWLAETGSLTQRLKRHCAGAFDLVVLSEADAPLPVDDAATLGLEPGVPVRVREVHMRCDGVPRIHARSLLPHATLAGAGRDLASLGERPLGDALFAHPDMLRGPIEVTDTPGWGRRSVFSLSGQPVLVTEWFLPALFECEG